MHADLLSYCSYTGLWLQPILSNTESIEGANSDDVYSQINSYENIVIILNSAAMSSFLGIISYILVGWENRSA